MRQSHPCPNVCKQQANNQEEIKDKITIGIMGEYETDQSMKAAVWIVEYKFSLCYIKVKFAKNMTKRKKIYEKNREKKTYENHLMQNFY